MIQNLRQESESRVVAGLDLDFGQSNGGGEEQGAAERGGKDSVGPTLEVV